MKTYSILGLLLAAAIISTVAADRWTCLDGQFKCDNGTCLGPWRRCNGHNDCDNGSDELNCDTVPCREHEWRCDNDICIVKQYRCNGDTDCPDGSDEDNCDTWTCDDNHFKCDDGTCIRYYHQNRGCDQISFGCADGSNQNDFAFVPRFERRNDIPNNIWSHEQCRNVGYFPNVQLYKCEQICRETSGCTAFNFKPHPGSDCDLRACGSWVFADKETPTGKISFYYAYKRGTSLPAASSHAALPELFEGPYYEENAIWDANECMNIDSFSAPTVEVCMQRCKETSNCTALNYKWPPQADCDLRNCGKVEYLNFPNGAISFYHAYRPIRNILDCFDQYADCPNLASFEDSCTVNSSWMHLNCKKSCGYCSCPDGYINSISSTHTQCLKVFDDKQRNWMDSRDKCRQENMKMPQSIDGTDLDFSYLGNETALWLDGRGDGTNMELQQSMSVLSNVSCECPSWNRRCLCWPGFECRDSNICALGNERCTSYISTNQCLRHRNHKLEPAYCFHTYTTVCEEVPSHKTEHFTTSATSTAGTFEMLFADGVNGPSFDTHAAHYFGQQWSTTTNTQNDFPFNPELCPLPNIWDECSMVCLPPPSDVNPDICVHLTQASCPPMTVRHRYSQKCVKLWKKKNFV